MVKLFVGNLPWKTEESELQAMFGEIGTVGTVQVLRDRETGRSRGFAFVEMTSQQDAQRAIDRFDGYTLGGRPLTVNVARPKPDARDGQDHGHHHRHRDHRDNRRREARW